MIAVAVRPGGDGDLVALARAFGTTPDFWLNLQKRYELESAEDAAGDALFAIEPLAAA